MNIREENVRKVLNEYDLERAKAENLCAIETEKIYKKCPELKQIKDKINLLGFENTKKIMKNPENAKKFNAEFNKELKKLITRKEKVMKENDIPFDFEKPKYNCSLCDDTGYVGDKKCECFEKRLIEMAYKDSNLSNLQDSHSFETFSFDFYSDEKGEDGKSDRDNIKGIYVECKSFCDNFDNYSKNLFLIGKPGLGKTFLSNSIAKELLDKGKSVVYMRSSALFNLYEEYKYGKNREEINLDRFYSADLLIIDDLGTEILSRPNVSFFFDLLNERIDKGKKIIINTNFSLNEISKAYTSRITSRIYESFKILHFKGEDIRIKKLK